jgi:hypothetical protein
MHHLKFKFTGFFNVFTQYALILRRSVFKKNIDDVITRKQITAWNFIWYILLKYLPIFIN